MVLIDKLPREFEKKPATKSVRICAKYLIHAVAICLVLAGRRSATTDRTAAASDSHSGVERRQSLDTET